MKLFEIHLTKFSWNWEEKRIFSLLPDNQIKMNWNVISLTINKANYMAIFNRRSILIQFESLPLKIFTCRKFVFSFIFGNHNNNWENKSNKEWETNEQQYVGAFTSCENLRRPWIVREILNPSLKIFSFASIHLNYR